MLARIQSDALSIFLPFHVFTILYLFSMPIQYKDQTRLFSKYARQKTRPPDGCAFCRNNKYTIIPVMMLDFGVCRKLSHFLLFRSSERVVFAFQHNLTKMRILSRDPSPFPLFLLSLFFESVFGLSQTPLRANITCHPH
jgi:hypothetical protein